MEVFLCPFIITDSLVNMITWVGRYYLSALGIRPSMISGFRGSCWEICDSAGSAFLYDWGFSLVAFSVSSSFFLGTTCFDHKIKYEMFFSGLACLVF